MPCRRWSQEAVKKWEGEPRCLVKNLYMCNVLSDDILTHRTALENYSEPTRKRSVDLLALETRLERVWVLCLGIGN
jgi:hypothetical protein